jgi:hypothetical protein
MIKNSTNINQQKEQSSLWTQKKRTMTNDVENPSPSLRQALTCGMIKSVKRLKGSQLSSLDSYIYNGNTYINKW